VLLVVLIGAVVYYLLMVQGEKRSRRQRAATAQIPAAKTEAAEETLRAVRQQMEQIQDEVSRQALLSRRESELSSRRIAVVVVWHGSAGKTLVNALIGRMLGRVDAPMGTTDVGKLIVSS